MASKIISGIAAAALMIASCGSAFAGASITSTKGSVLVNGGSGYTAATGGTQLKAGDRIMVGANGKAVVDFGRGCSLPVEPGRVITIGTGNPCATKASEDSPDSATWLLPGIGVIVIVGGIIWLISDDDDDSSP